MKPYLTARDGVLTKKAERILMDEAIIREIKRAAWRLKSCWLYHDTPFDDLYQRLAIHAITSLKKYTKGQAEAKGFVKQTLNRRSCTMKRNDGRNGRLMERQQASLETMEDMIEAQSEFDAGWADPLLTRVDTTLERASREELQEIINHVIRQLPSKRRPVCDLFKNHSIAEIVVSTGLSRNTVERWFKEFVAHVRAYVKVSEEDV